MFVNAAPGPEWRNGATKVDAWLGCRINVDIAKIIRNNLNRSGQFNALTTEALITNQIDFNFWQEHKKDAVVFGKIEFQKGRNCHINSDARNIIRIQGF